MGTHLPAVHLVGSVPLESAEAVFRAAAGTLGPYVRRIPDGETGDRTNWIRYQLSVVADHPSFEPDVDGPPPQPRFRLRTGVDASGLAFGSLGYARVALRSYETFAALKAAGVVPADTRFQVSLPTPIAIMIAFVTERDQAAVEAAYRAAMLAEVADILAVVPAEELAVQWDVAIEIALLEGIRTAGVDASQAALVRRLADLAAQVPAPAEVGFHLCYGDSGHQHFVQPTDTALLTRVANGIVEAVHRPPAWIHLPVPRDRVDEAYFAPLKALRLPENTQLFLGLVHATDGLAGARRRMAAAGTAGQSFGVGTECGLGRRDPASIPALLELHRQVAER
ncbi:hypothetical protein [Fodinicola feengrottensis]|uniref:Methionine synthase n=1 Tax=Fodinicola feengrottensis TaxID=435914 RepID=A0ABN2JEZ2_9ACTN|nr:hypothetical protein [Fodinicola feengrottensis]